MADICCPHCGMWIPVSGQGAKTIVKMPGLAKTKLPGAEKPKNDLKTLLGEHYDNYWRLANLFGPNKNYQPMQSAPLYLQALQHTTHESIFTQAVRITRLTEPKYLPQLTKWLEGQGYMTPEEGNPDDITSSRLSSRRRAE